MIGLVTGATGFIGRHLVRALATEAPPNVTSRSVESAQRILADAGTHRAFAWDPVEAPLPAAALRTERGPVEVVFHLAGEPVADGRWDAARKRRIHESRALGTRNLVDALARADVRPRALVSASAVGYYGSRGDEILDERAEPADDFLARVCRDWEAEAGRGEALGVRVVTVRIGVVLGEDGGALAKMARPFRLGAGGPLAGGAHWMPWVHVDDVVGLMLHAARRADVRGPLNAVAPDPVRNRDFTRALGAALHRPALLPVPAFAVRLAFGELSSVLLASQRVVPRVAEATGYRFRHVDLAGALRASITTA